MFHDLVDKNVNDIALINGQSDQRTSYDDLQTAGRQFACGIQRLGLQRGDRVAILLEKCSENVAAMVGTSMSDCTFVPINQSLKRAQVEHILRDSGAKILITNPLKASWFRETLEKIETLEVVVLAYGQSLVRPSDYDKRLMMWHELLTEPRGWPDQKNISKDPAAIFYTSGSTGKPKGVVVSHANIEAGARSVCKYLDLGNDDIILSLLPWSFDAGFSQLTTAFAVGAQVVLHDYIGPWEVPSLVEKYSCNVITGVPTLWTQLLSVKWSENQLAPLDVLASTGGRVPVELVEDLSNQFKTTQLYLMYGLTEAFRSTFLDPTCLASHPDSIGKAIPDQEIFLLDINGRLIEGPGEGQLAHRGSTVALGYWNDVIGTEKKFMSWGPNERVVLSGDTVRRDEEGFLYFVGRNDDMIKTRGYRVSPTEVEDAVYTTGLVTEVCAVPFEGKDGEIEIGIYVVPKEVQSMGAVLSEMMALTPTYMHPKGYKEVEFLPKLSNGKIDRSYLKGANKWTNWQA